MILLQLVHPYLNNSRANRALLAGIDDIPGLVINELYEHYPDFYINKSREQQLLKSCDMVIFQFPIYWYSAPALLKQWQEVVLGAGFAHGDNGDALQGKQLLTAVTTGQGVESYDGFENTIDELLSPWRRTALHCGMNYLTPFVVYGVETASDDVLIDAAKRYRELLESVINDLEAGEH